MDLTQIKIHQLQARKERDIVKATLLTTLIGEIETQLKNNLNKSSEPIVLQTILKFVKNLNESLKLKHTDLAEQELNILKKYLPEPLTNEEIEKLINECINKGLNFGGIMKMFTTNYKGRYDSKVLSSTVKKYTNCI